MGLLDLIRGTQKSAKTGSTTAINATDVQEPSEAVAQVALAGSRNQESYVPPVDPELNPDRYCWPNSTAMNSGEIDTFKYRLLIFQAKGLDETAAEALADKLVLRDRDGDDRKVCFECRNLKGVSGLRCQNWKMAGIAYKSSDSFIGKDFAMLPQRCDGFDP